MGHMRIFPRESAKSDLFLILRICPPALTTSVARSHSPQSPHSTPFADNILQSSHSSSFGGRQWPRNQTEGHLSARVSHWKNVENLHGTLFAEYALGVLLIKVLTYKHFNPFS